MSKRLGWKDTANAMRNGRVLMKTLATDGASYALDNGVGVSAKAGGEMTAQLSLLSAPRDAEIVPNEDGLFPGMSQTWRVL